MESRAEDMGEDLERKESWAILVVLVMWTVWRLKGKVHQDFPQSLLQLILMAALAKLLNPYSFFFCYCSQSLNPSV